MAQKRKRADAADYHHDDLYAVLQVSRNASQREIVQAYHRQALLVHPDKGGEAGRFCKVAHAYEILADNSARDAYHMSLLQHGFADGFTNHASDKDAAASKVHVLAGFPRDMVQVLLAASPKQWRQLLQGFRSNQLGALLQCLQNSVSLPKAEQSHQILKQDGNAQHLRMQHLIFRKGKRSYEAVFTMGGFEIRTPSTNVLAVASYYHSAIMEMRRFIVEALRGALPGSPLESAVLQAIERLDSRGFSCPFIFRGRRDMWRTPSSADLPLALKMHKELLGLTTAAGFNSAKKRWEKMVEERREPQQTARQQRAKELQGYIIAQQEACKLLPFRRVGKQPCDLTLKVPFLGKLAATLGQSQAELERQLQGVDGQRALLQFFAKRKKLLALPAVGWEQCPQSQKALILAFTPMVDCLKLRCTNRKSREHVQYMRCHEDVLLTRQDFPTNRQILAFLQHDFLQGAKVLDLRRLPDEVMSSKLLWASLMTLHGLQCVVINESHVTCPPAGLSRFSVRVSLTGHKRSLH